jgi:hypothetical protein
MIYQNLKTKNLAGLAGDDHWSSTRDGTVWIYINFSNGSFGTGDTKPRVVRVVRSF